MVAVAGLNERLERVAIILCQNWSGSRRRQPSRHWDQWHAPCDQGRRSHQWRDRLP